MKISWKNIENSQRYALKNFRVTPVKKRSIDQPTRVATITLNNPLKLNALTVELGDEFTRVVEELKEEVSLHQLEDHLLKCLYIFSKASRQLRSCSRIILLKFVVNWRKYRQVSHSYEGVHLDVDP